MKRLGPELKMPDLKNLKVPEPLADVYYDLRDRRLLPLVALVVVAIAAVPFLLSSDAEQPELPVAAEAATAELEKEIGGASSLTVVESQPGLRDYRKRLRKRAPTDPFKQRYTSLPKEAQLSSTVGGGSQVDASGGGASSVSVTEVEEDVVEVDDGPAGPQGSGAPAGEPKGEGNGGTTQKGSDNGLDGRRLYGYRPDVRFGMAGSGDLVTHEELPLATLLPKKNAVALFVGATQNGKRAFFSLTPDVTRVRGDGDCVGGKQNCRILSLRADQAVDLLTDSPNRAFRLKVLQINLVEIKIPSKHRDASGSSATGTRQGWARGLSIAGHE